MANPSLPINSSKFDYDGLHMEVEGIVVNDKVVVSTQQALVADLDITFTANAPTPATTQTIADGTVPTVAELGQFAANTEAKLAAILDVLEAHGLMADA